MIQVVSFNMGSGARTKADMLYAELFQLIGPQRLEDVLRELMTSETKRIEESCCFQTPAYRCEKPAKYTVRGKLTRGHGETQVWRRSCPTHVGHLMGRPPEGQWTDTRWVVDQLMEEE